MIKKSLYILLFLICITVNSFAQEYLLGIRANQEILSTQSKKKSFLKSTPFTDTLSLPFFDDFSGKSIYPDQNLWVDNYVYINNRFAKYPPSIGFATFDVIDSHGTIYENAKSTSFSADTLTSKPIFLGPDYTITVNTVDIEGISIQMLYYFDTCKSSYQLLKDSTFVKDTDTTFALADESNMYNLSNELFYKCDSLYYQINDSLYYYNTDSSKYYYIPRNNVSRRLWDENDDVVLSFYYLPQGIAEAPEVKDSLKLQLYAPEEGVWYDHLAFEGSDVVDNFILATVPITDSKFLNKGFRFRFVNLASISDDPQYGISNCDFWHLDYVYLDKNRSADSIYFPDVTHVSPLATFLTNYESIPWDHYVNSSADLSERRTKFTMTIRNLNETGKGPRRSMIFKDYDNDTVIDVSNETATPIIGDTIITVTKDYGFPLDAYLDNTRETARFELMAVIHNDDSLEISVNDTISHIQHFRNYYAYDDGSAETGYYLSGQGTINAKGAMYNKYYLSDTLKAIQFYFNQSYDSANFLKFKPAIWEDNSDEPGELIYEFEEQYPQFRGINKFCEFPVPEDTLIILPKDVWIGWIQTSEDVLDIGFDLNTNRNSTMLKYNINGFWVTSSFEGTIMIRPVFDELLPLKIKDLKIEEPDFLVYPNPAQEFINIQHPYDLEMTDLNYKVFNSMGQIIFSSNYYTEQINVQEWKSGFYFLRISDQKTFTTNKKIIIQ